MAGLEQAFTSANRGTTAPSESALRAFVERARSERPHVPCDDRALIEFVAATVASDAASDASLTDLAAGDLLLACACVARDAVALAAFEAELVPIVRATLGRMRAAAGDIDDVAQLVCLKLLVGDEKSPPRIGAYAGRSDLKRWVKAIAARAWIDHQRGNRREVLVDDELVFEEIARPDDPELVYLKQRYREELKEAFFEALAQLSDVQKNVLRHRHVDNLIVEDIAAIYQAHRATVHRWLAEARDELASSTQKILRKKLSLTSHEYDSLCRLVQSQLDWSISRAL